jgi:hypothetical protein
MDLEAAVADLSELKKLAEAAAHEGEGDWFDPELVESDEPILSTRKARRFIAAASPEVVLRLIAVAEAAKYVAYSNGFDAAYQDKLEALRSALQELEK